VALRSVTARRRLVHASPLTTDRYIKAASGRDYADIRPVSGTYRGGKTRSLTVDVRVRQPEAANL